MCLFFIPSFGQFQYRIFIFSFNRDFDGIAWKFYDLLIECFKNKNCNRLVIKKEIKMNSSEMEISDKTTNRTHHTRFFEKLYGNLEKSSDVKEDESLKVINSNFQLNMPSEVITHGVLNSPSGSSGSSSENFHNDLSASRCENYFNFLSCFLGLKNLNSPFRHLMFLTSNEIGLNTFPTTILPSHFGALRLPIGFSSDPHNHFAAFRELFAFYNLFILLLEPACEAQVLPEHA